MDKSATYDANKLSTSNGGREKEEFRAVKISERNPPPWGNKCDETAASSDTFYSLFRMASPLDIILVVVSVLFAMSTGVCWPIQVAIFGKLCNAFIAFTSTQMNLTSATEDTNCLHRTGPNSSLSESLIEFTVECGAFHVILIIQTLIFVTFLNISAEKQTHRCRNALMKAMLSQDITWYDNQLTEGLPTVFSEHLQKLQEGFGEKLGILISSVSYVIFSFAVAVYHGWKLSLIAMAILPTLTIASGIIGKILSSTSAIETKAYSEAGAIVEEVISAVKTVVLFGGQDREVDRFQALLMPARDAGMKRGLAVAIGSSFVWVMTYCCYGLTFWYGIGLILESCEQYDAGSLNVIFFCLLMAAMKMGQIFPLWDTFKQAKIAASQIFEIIDKTPAIEKSIGLQPEIIEGKITFHRVEFVYPSRPDVPVLRDVTFQVEAGETIALVGQTGCGKSTCTQLIQRFYDPKSGFIKIDDFDLANLDLKWLRNQIGVVGQEPVLFNMSIKDNIRYGCPEESDATQEEIETAAIHANAHGFITKLPRGYDTCVGERGAQLSGGQKQRIAIARALLKHPKILLLDEATSALDTESERAVQKALDEARKGRTTIIVAHRLSTIRHADRILVMNNGVVEEEGNHDSLMKKGGLYYQLVKSQHAQNTSNEVLNKAGSVEVQTEKRAGKNFAVSIQNDKTSLTGEGKSQSSETSIWNILKWNAPEWHYIVLGIIGSTMVGISTPIYAINYGELMGLLGKPRNEDVTQEKNYYSLMFLVIALTAGLGAFLQNYMLSIAGEKLTYRLRVRIFKAILQREMDWFDKPENNVGSLCSRLSSDASAVQGGTGARLGVIFQVLSGITFGLLIGFFCSWKLALVSGFFAPLMMLSGFVGVKISIGEDSSKAKALENSVAVATEAISSIRTVKSLGREETFKSNYMSCLEDPHLKYLRRAPRRGLIYALTVYGSSTVAVFSFAYGGYLVLYEGLAYKEVFKITEALIFGMEMIGQAMAFTPNYGRAKAAAGRIYNLLIEDSKENYGSIDFEMVDGPIDFEDVRFHYSIRPDVTVLDGIKFEVPTGKTVALVGKSGSGKSTCAQLLQRFYEPVSGAISVDKRNIRSSSVKSFRTFIGAVSQEPILFNRTIAENIAYGDLNRTITLNEIIKAATDANVHSFISSLPLGYETIVGSRGVQLSGGQKQRVAIARILIRNPKILILDEATSALDSECERAVQEALDRAGEGRTCLVIAHQLSTIKRAHNILVIEQGKVIEQGSHDELLSKRGEYYRLWSGKCYKQ